jgi:hypothetical protein
MEQLEKFQLINSCETAEDLIAAIKQIADPETGMVQGRAREFKSAKMASYVTGIINGNLPPELLTREFGIRQQALYIRYYETTDLVNRN